MNQFEAVRNWISLVIYLNNPHLISIILYTLFQQSLQYCSIHSRFINIWGPLLTTRSKFSLLPLAIRLFSSTPLNLNIFLLFFQQIPHTLGPSCSNIFLIFLRTVLNIFMIVVYHLSWKLAMLNWRCHSSP